MAIFQQRDHLCDWCRRKVDTASGFRPYAVVKVAQKRWAGAAIFHLQPVTTERVGPVLRQRSEVMTLCGRYST